MWRSAPTARASSPAAADNTVRLWDADTGQPVGQPLTGHTDVVTSVAFSPDGTRIVSGSDDNTVRLWDADTGQPIGAAADRPHRRGDQCGVQPRRAPHRLRQLTTRRCGCGTPTPANRSAQPLTGHTGAVYSVAFSPDGTRIVSGSDDKTVRLWDADTGQPIGAAADRPHRRGVQRGVQPRRHSASSPAATTRRCGCGTPTPANRSASR